MKNAANNSIISIFVLIICLLVSHELSNYQFKFFAQALLSTSGNIGNNLKIYMNNLYKFVISYPSNWDKIEFSQGITESGRQIIVTFLSPLEGPSDSFREYLTIEVANLPGGTPIDKSSLTRYAIDQIDGYRRSLHGFHPLTLSAQTNSTNLSDGGLSCYTISYSYIDSTVGKIDALDMYCAKDSKIYLLSFRYDSTKYSLFLPIAKQIDNSFKVK
jgi:hypothetical protein